MADNVVSGGGNLDRHIKQIRANPDEISVKIGVRPNAKYPDGTPVARVALAHEFGTTDVPERAIFRQAFHSANANLQEHVRSNPIMSKAAARAVGNNVLQGLKNNIIEAKLVDSGLLLRSLFVEVIVN